MELVWGDDPAFWAYHTDRCLFVSDAAIEPMNKQWSKVFLTVEPVEVLNLLGYKEMEF